MSSIQDPVAAVVAYLKAVSAVSALVGTRVFGGEIPDTESENMPRKTVHIYRTGGRPEHYVALQVPRMDIACYGETPYQANQVALEVTYAMKYGGRQTYASTLIHVATQIGGPLDARHPDEHWPYVWTSWSVMVGEETTA